MGNEFYSIEVVLEMEDSHTGSGLIFLQTQLNSYKRNKKSLNVAS